MQTNNDKIIHVGRINKKGKGFQYVILRQSAPKEFHWFLRNEIKKSEEDTGLSAHSLKDAIHLARKSWKSFGFRTVKCGFRFTLPERDEHGLNALFYQMSASLSGWNGIYFDDELGHNCVVRDISDEARTLWKSLEV